MSEWMIIKKIIESVNLAPRVTCASWTSLILTCLLLSFFFFGDLQRAAQIWRRPWPLPPSSALPWIAPLCAPSASRWTATAAEAVNATQVGAELAVGEGGGNAHCHCQWASAWAEAMAKVWLVTNTVLHLTEWLHTATTLSSVGASSKAICKDSTATVDGFFPNVFSKVGILAVYWVFSSWILLMMGPEGNKWVSWLHRKLC